MSTKTDIQSLQHLIVDALEDVKGKDIVVFDTEHLSALFERVIIVSGSSNRQTKALASSVRDAVRDKGLPKPRVEGEANGEWIIVDCGSAVVHVMQPIIREYYRLEDIWGDKPVRIKQAKARGLVKASEPMTQDSPVKKPAAKKASTTKASADKATAGGPKASGSAAKKTAAKKAPVKQSVAPAAKKAATANKVAAKQAPVQKSVAKPKANATKPKTVVVNKPKPAAKKPVAKKAPAKKAPAKQVVAKKAASKPAAKQSVAKKPAAKKPAAKQAK